MKINVEYQFIGRADCDNCGKKDDLNIYELNGKKYCVPCKIESEPDTHNAQDFQESILNGLTPAQYQAKNGMAWNE